MVGKTIRKNYAGPSIADLTAEREAGAEWAKDKGDEPEPEPKKRDHNAGRAIYKRELAKFAKLDEVGKQDLLRETWKEVAMGAAARAKAFVTTCSSKEFRGLSQVISAGVEALEAAFPQAKQPIGPQFIVNMFGTLGQRAAAIATPPVPTIDITPTEDQTWPDSGLTKMTPSLPTTLEMSATKKQ